MPSILICTVGTSLFRPNLENLKHHLQRDEIEDEDRRALAKAYSDAGERDDWDEVAERLRRIPPTERVCGAEINSIASMIDKDYVDKNCGLFFLHSDTDAGRQIAAILTNYYQKSGHTPVEAISVADLQDQDSRAFRTKGLRNLARNMCKVIRERSAAACAINATGGYKAQIAIAVALGQALGITVYYKHEFFSEIIAVPPMPIALDYELWMRASGMLYTLVDREIEEVEEYQEEWDERYEALIERETLDAVEYLSLAPTGQIFHDAFRERFRTSRDQVLPPPALAKQPPRMEDAGWPGEHPEVRTFMQRVTDVAPFVTRCETFYYNPDLPRATRFAVSRANVICVFSDGNYCVKFTVHTTATSPGQSAAAAAALNQWLADGQDAHYFAPEQGQVAELRGELKETQKAWEDSETELEKLRLENAAFHARVERFDKVREQLTTEIETLKQQNSALADQLELSRQRIETARRPWWKKVFSRAQQ